MISKLTAEQQAMVRGRIGSVVSASTPGSGVVSQTDLLAVARTVGVYRPTVRLHRMLYAAAILAGALLIACVPTGWWLR